MAEQVNRKDIREKAVALLKAAVTEVSNRVFENRMRPVFQSELPCIVVYSRNESAEISSQAPREYKRTLRLVAEIIAKADETVDDTLDLLARKVEKAFFVNETLDSLVGDTVLGETEIEISGEGQTLHGACRMEWLVEYYTLAPGDEALAELDDFETANVDWKPNGATDESQGTVDEIELPQE